MKKRHWYTTASGLARMIIFTGLLAYMTACTSENMGKVQVGTNGAVSVISIPEEADSVVIFAASELRDYLSRMTHAELPVKRAGEIRNREMAIRFSPGSYPDIKWDGFRIIANNRGITVQANESRAMLYAVYQLLENAGCSFVYPGEDEEIIPEKDILIFPEGRQLFNPLLEHRGLVPYGLDSSSVDLGRKFIDWMAKNKLNYIMVSEERRSDCPGNAHANIWQDVAGQLLPELQKRGFVIEMSEHTLPRFFPRSLFSEHPGWFSLIDGKRKAGPPPYYGNICYSNKDAVDYYAHALADYAVKHPEFSAIGTWPLDGSNYCECAGCQKPRTYFNAIMHVAETVHKARPDITVEHLAYRPLTWAPPSMNKIPENMSVLWCLDNGKKEDIAKDWVDKASDSGGVYQFEYYMGDNYRSKANLWLRPENAFDVVQYATKTGYRGVISLFLPIQNWWRSAFNVWFFSKACWNPHPGIYDLLHEYCVKYYGADSTRIERVFNTVFTELQPEPYVDPQSREFTHHLMVIDSIAPKLVFDLNMIFDRTDKPPIMKNIVRLKTYVGFFRVYADAFASRKPEDLDRLVQYSKDHPDQHMVLMYPQYIRWRLGEEFRK